MGKWIVKKQTEIENYTLEIIDGLKTYLVTDKAGNVLFKESFIDQPSESIKAEWLEVYGELKEEVESLMTQQNEDPSM